MTQRKKDEKKINLGGNSGNHINKKSLLLPEGFFVYERTARHSGSLEELIEACLFKSRFSSYAKSHYRKSQRQCDPGSKPGMT